MTSVTFPTNLGGSGATVSDDADPNTGLANGGHRTRFIPALQGTIDMASYVYQYAGKIDNAAADADRAENARGYVEAVADQYQVNILEQFKQKATLVSDFANQDFKLYDGLRKNDIADTSLWNITRATTGTYVDATGKIRTAAIDEPRYTYDSETGKALGIWQEGNVTNFFKYSEDFTAADWSKTRCTLVATSEQAVNGGVYYRLVVNNDEPNGYVTQPAINAASGQYVTAWCVAKKEDLNQFRLFFVHIGDNLGDTSQAVFSLTEDGVLSTSGLIVDAKTIPNSDGSYLLYATMQVNSATDISVRILQEITGNGSSGILMSHASLSKTGYPPSYIKTLGTTVTKTPDFISTDMVGNIGDEGTFYIKYRQYADSNNTVANIFGCLIRMNNAGSGVIATEGFTPGFVIYTNDIEDEKKLAVVFNQNGTCSIIVNGALEATGNYEFLNTLIEINPSSSKVSEVYYVPRALTTAELETLTAI